MGGDWTLKESASAGSDTWIRIGPIMPENPEIPPLAESSTP
jgi:hypothetical protein